MLSKFQSECYKLIGLSFYYLYEIPLRWDPKTLTIYTRPKSKWYPWYIGMVFVFILWLNCVYILATAPIFERKRFNAMHLCLFTTGFMAFGSVLLAANSLISSNFPQILSAVNFYLHLELYLYKRFEPSLLHPPFGILDASFLAMVGGCFMPYTLYLACIYFDFDGPYWVIEDWAPDPTEREPRTIFIFLAIRTFFILPGFIETARTILVHTPIMLYFIVSAYRTVWVIAHRINDSNAFFQVYSQLSVVSTILEKSTTRVFMVNITMCYLLFIQTWWIMIRGYGEVQESVYLMFGVIVVLLTCATLIFMPFISRLGDIINALPKAKKAEMKQKHVQKKTLRTKISLKKANAIMPLCFSYGRFYPLGANFCRNLFGNAVENLMGMVLLVDFHGNVTF